MASPMAPFKLHPSPLIGGIMLAVAIGFDALQLWITAAFAVTVIGIPIGIAFGTYVAFFAYILFYVWFKITDRDSQNHFILSRAVAMWGPAIVEFCGGEIFPGISISVVLHIILSWLGDAQANRFAREEVEGKVLSERDDIKLQKRWQSLGPEKEDAARTALERAVFDRADTRKKQEVLNTNRAKRGLAPLTKEGIAYEGYGRTNEERREERALLRQGYRDNNGQPMNVPRGTSNFKSIYANDSNNRKPNNKKGGVASYEEPTIAGYAPPAKRLQEPVKSDEYMASEENERTL